MTKCNISCAAKLFELFRISIRMWFSHLKSCAMFKIPALLPCWPLLIKTIVMYHWFDQLFYVIVWCLNAACIAGHWLALCFCTFVCFFKNCCRHTDHDDVTSHRAGRFVVHYLLLLIHLPLLPVVTAYVLSLCQDVKWHKSSIFSPLLWHRDNRGAAVWRMFAAWVKK